MKYLIKLDFLQIKEFRNNNLRISLIFKIIIIHNYAMINNIMSNILDLIKLINLQSFQKNIHIVVFHLK